MARPSRIDIKSYPVINKGDPYTLSYDIYGNKKDTKIQIIKELVKYGYNHSEIARFFGYDNSMISKILNNEV